MKRISFLLIALFLLNNVWAVPPLEEGKVIFSSRCAACHNVNKVLTGPALAGVDERRSIDWIVKFVHSSQSVVQSGDPYAVALFNKFNKIQMPDHPDLSDDNIKSIVEFIKAESKVAVEKPPFEKPGKLRPNYMPISINNYGLWFGYSLLVIVLIGTLLFAVRIKELLRKNTDD